MSWSLPFRSWRKKILPRWIIFQDVLPLSKFPQALCLGRTMKPSSKEVT
jgi:hypothetical protein